MKGERRGEGGHDVCPLNNAFVERDNIPENSTSLWVLGSCLLSVPLRVRGCRVSDDVPTRGTEETTLGPEIEVLVRT